MNEEKGYGIITPDDGGEDLFAQFASTRSNCSRPLWPNQCVRFEMSIGPDGKQAANIATV
ncbi:MAG TPA: cold shock domain-containing protein [Gallionellaceae bacterium]|nr:cold shock domain-containing protein [Gallionellaceae bacterium]